MLRLHVGGLFFFWGGWPHAGLIFFRGCVRTRA